MSERRSLVVAKFGSELIVDDTGIRQDLVDSYAAGLSTHHDGQDLIVVTSGAVAAGRVRRRTRLERDDSNILPEQLNELSAQWDSRVLAQLGMASIARAWEVAFDKAGRDAGGVLLTHHQLNGDKESSTLRDALRESCGQGIISIVNENDMLSDTELMKLLIGGDNDGLASHLARSLGAHSLRLFTKRGGIVDNDKNLIGRIDSSNHDKLKIILEERMRHAASDGTGRGGIVSKLDAAWQFSQATGCQAEIAQPNESMSGSNQTVVSTSD